MAHVRPQPIVLRDATNAPANSSQTTPNTSLADSYTPPGQAKNPSWIGWRASIIACILSSWINTFILLTPLAWAIHNHSNLKPIVKFTLLFVSLVPLVRLSEWCGKQLSLHCGQELGDLIYVTMSNFVEVILAFFLLHHCELRILQSTIVGVILLRLLLIPGVAFFTGGALVAEQTLSSRFATMNQTLLTVGVLALLVPTALFAALDRGQVGALSAEVSSHSAEDAAKAASASVSKYAASAISSAHTAETTLEVVEHVRRATFERAVETVESTASVGLSEITRNSFLKMSHGIAIILIVIYIGSRIYLHNPPKDDWDEERVNKVPKTNVWVCIVTLSVVTVTMAISIHRLVENIQFIREEGVIQEESFGLVVLPIISYSADALLAIAFWCRSRIGTPPPIEIFAQARAIDVGVQFALFWMPVIVLVSWMAHRPFIMLFDVFEVTMLVGACFLLNYVTSDGKTNWSEGLCLIGFYTIIVLCSHFYPGQPELHALMTCASVAVALAGGGDAAH